MTDDPETPRRISDREVPLDLAGYLMPMEQAPNTPVLIGMPGTDDLFIVVFSTSEKLQATMMSYAIGYDRVAIVTDGHELLDDLRVTNASGHRPYRIRLA